MRSENRAPGTTWLLRHPKINRFGIGNGFVRTGPHDTIEVGHYGTTAGGQSMVLSRGDARLLAKRINQCLDETRLP